MREIPDIFEDSLGTSKRSMKRRTGYRPMSLNPHLLPEADMHEEMFSLKSMECFRARGGSTEGAAIFDSAFGCS